VEWSIQDVARSAGTTSRTLRHYDDIGLLPPSRVGGNGYRYYDEDALVRLQRILLRPRCAPTCRCSSGSASGSVGRSSRCAAPCGRRKEVND